MIILSSRNNKKTNKSFKSWKKGTYYRVHGAKSFEVNNKTAIIFIHGYNNDLANAVSLYNGMSAFFDKSNFDAYGFTWASSGKIVKYYSDIVKARKAAVALCKIASDMKKAGYNKVYVIAHSMGCYLTMRALMYTKTNYLFNGIAVLGADLARYRFKKKRRYAKLSHKVSKILAYYSDSDRILNYIARGTRPFKRVGRYGFRRQPSNFKDFNAERFGDKTVRHNEYFSNKKLLDDVIGLLT